MASRFAKLKETLRYDGPLVFAWKVLTRVVSPFAELGGWILFDVDLTQPREEMKAKVDVEVREATAEDIERISFFANLVYARGSDPSDMGEYDPRHQKVEREYVSKIMLDRFERGAKCFIATAGDQVAHVNWICIGWDHLFIPDRRFELGPDEVYTTDGYTTVAWRGKGVHEEVNNAMLLYARRNGYKRAFTIAELGRRRSHKGLYRVGWKVTGKVITFKIRGRFFMVRLGGDISPLLR